MRQVIPNYAFTPGAAGAGTITLPDFTTLDLARLVMIVNATRGQVLYNITDATKRASIAGNVVTLTDVNTAGHSAGDKLAVTYDVSRDDPDYQDPTVVGTETQTWRDDFDDAAIDSALWTTTQVGTGATIAESGGFATLTSGTNANDSITIRSKKSFTLPFRVQVTAQFATRIANQTAVIQVRNAAGDTVASWVLDGTVNTTAKVRATHKTRQATADTAVTIPASTAMTTYELDCRADGVEYIYRPTESITIGTTAASRVRSIPQPGERYTVEIALINAATAPASSTNLVLETVLVQEVSKHVVEIAAGRANHNLNRSVPATITNSPSLGAGANRIGLTAAAGVWQEVSATALAANGTITGTGRDLTGTAAATVFGSGTFAKEYRVSATADVAGTLYLEVSRDNVTWRRIKSVALAQAAGTATVFYGELIHLPSVRYARAAFVNGATIQTAFTLEEILLAA